MYLNGRQGGGRKNLRSGLRDSRSTPERLNQIRRLTLGGMIASRTRPCVYASSDLRQMTSFLSEHR
jgi:hypothetical protein